MLSFILLFAVFCGTAQINCEGKIEKAKKILDSKKLYNNYETLFQEISGLATEQINELSSNIDMMSTHDIITMINNEDSKVNKIPVRNIEP